MLFTPVLHRHNVAQIIEIFYNAMRFPSFDVISVHRKATQFPLAHDGWNGTFESHTHGWRLGGFVVEGVEILSLIDSSRRKNNFKEVGDY